MQEAMRLMHQEMGKLDPATRQQIEQLMQVPASAGKDRSRPARDPGQLAALSVPLAPAALRDHVEALQPKLAAALSPTARERAEKIDAELRKAIDYLPRLRATANGLAAWGAWPEATYLIGRVARASGEVQDLSNLAAMLTMQNAGTAALPILSTLDARYPENSTLKNNLGQAHYALDDLAEGEQYLVAAIRITPLHPQANMTLARLQAARGDKAAAQESLHKAMQGGFSKEKQDQLRKAGGKLRPEDVRWLRPMPQDPLGLHRLEPPPYPRKAMDLPALVPAWKAFQQQLQDRQASLGRRGTAASEAVGNPMGMMGAAMAIANSSLAHKASLLLKADTEHYEIQLKRLSKTMGKAMEASAAAELELHRRIEAIDAAGEEKYANVPGGYSYEFSCGEVMGEIDRYYAATSPVIEPMMLEWRGLHRRHLNEIAFLSQYTSPGPEMYEVIKLSSMGGYLSILEGPLVSLLEGLLSSRRVCFQQAKQPEGGGKLPEFDDIHCEYLSTMTLPGVGTIVSRCNVTEANFEPIFAPLKANWASDVAKDRVLHASAQVTVDFVTVGGHSEFDTAGLASGGLSVGATTDLGPKLKGGPLEIGVEGGVSAGLEFDRSGLTDVVIQAGVTSTTSSTIGKTEAAGSKAAVSAGASSSWSWNSGYSGAVSAGFDSSVF